MASLAGRRFDEYVTKTQNALNQLEAGVPRADLLGIVSAAEVCAAQLATAYASIYATELQGRSC